jgi:hypothetical protein
MGQHDRAFIAEAYLPGCGMRRSLEELASTNHPAKLALAVLVREQGYSLRDLARDLDDRWRMGARVQVASRRALLPSLRTA